MQVGEDSGRLVIEIVQIFLAALRSVDPSWVEAWLRFVQAPGSSEVKASFDGPNGVRLINSLKEKAFFDQVMPKGEELFRSLGSEVGLFLLVVKF